MTFNPHAATVDEMRDWLQVHLHHKYLDSLGPRATSEDYYKDPPTIPATLDWVASHLERCFYYEISKEGNERNPWIGAFALHENWKHPTVIEAKTRLECEFRLLCLVLMAEDESKGKEGFDAVV